MAPAAQREPIEERDDLHYASVHISRSKNQEVPLCMAGSRVQSDQTDEVFYSVVNVKRLNAVRGSDQTEVGESTEMYSTVRFEPAAAAGFKYSYAAVRRGRLWVGSEGFGGKCGLWLYSAPAMTLPLPRAVDAVSRCAFLSHWWGK
ncbi:hypothetical protein N1851_014274 [Merluccius polli]|uniref:Uncharacterized protein n=1 Tax=Merluccius polli TaxID=89951 RepID=A0AA47MUS1_MERPO|nr:hypothetical protein N1851_014274 [Merluccius polli]